MLDKLVFKITLPMMLFLDMAKLDLVNEFDTKYVLFCAVATTLAFGGVWGIAALTLKDKVLVGEFTQSSYRSSAAILGMAFISNMYGTSSMGPLMMIGSVPLFNVFAVIVLGLTAPEGKGADFKATLKRTLKNIITNPIIDAIALGLVFSALGIHALPGIVNKVCTNLSGLTSPLALLSIGATFEGSKAIARIRPTLGASAFKLVILVAVFMPAAVALGFRDEKLIALLVMLGSPATPTSYIMARQMGHEGVLSSSVIALTTLLSSISLTVWIFVLRSMGFV